MSEDYCGFKNEDSETAFLAGVLDVLIGNLSLCCKFPYTLDGDIFYIKDGDISVLNSSIKKRLHSYNEMYWHNALSDKIESLDIKLIKNACEVNSDLLCKELKEYADNSKSKDAVDEFLRDLNWYLGKPKCVYYPKSNNDNNLKLLAEMYLYIGNRYFFISYGCFVVFVIIGTVE